MHTMIKFGAGSTRRHAHLLGSAALTGLLTLAIHQGAAAQTAPVASNPSQGAAVLLDDVVVTASKRSEVLSRAPLTVSAVSQAAMDRQGITDTVALSTSVPNLQIGIQATGGAQLSIRGISSNNVTELGNPAVAFHIDGVYEPRTEGVNQILYDVDRIEVLRGPQGTLYGRNATAGSVNVITASPTHSFEGRADVAYGSYNEVTVRGMVNVPVTDSLALRATVTRAKNDGYFDNKGSVPRDYELTDEYGARLTALWTPTDAFSWQLSADYFSDRGTPRVGVVFPIRDGLPLRDRPVNTPGFVDQHQVAVRSRMSYEITPELSVTYVAGYGALKGEIQYDGDGTTRNVASTYYKRDQDHHSNEIDVSYNTDKLKLIGGVFDFGEHPDIVLVSASNGTTETHFYDNTISQASRAVFSQGTYSVTDRFRVTAGIRYSADEIKRPKQINYTCPYGTTINPAGPAGCKPVTTILNQDRHFHNTSYKVGAEYDVAPGTLGYASVSTGYKAGGLGNTIFPDFGPEHITNYEAGLKSRLLDGRLQLTGAVFYSDYKDLQVTSTLTLPGTTTQLAGTTNAAAASVKGLELEAAWAPTSADRVQAYFTYLDAKYDSFMNAVDTLRDATGKTTFDASGNDLVLSPPESARVSYQHTFDFAGGTLVSDIAVYWQARMYLRPFNLPADLQKSYSKSDFSLTYNPPIEGVSIEAFVHNIEDSEIATNEGVAAGVPLRYFQPPRTFGGRLGYRF